LSPRALEVARNRRTKVQSWYLDVNLLASYWGQDRVYHHTAPISMNYALHEALRLVLIEGLEKPLAPARAESSRAQGRSEGDGTVDCFSGRPSTVAAQRGHGCPKAWTKPRCASDCLLISTWKWGAGLGPFKGKNLADWFDGGDLE